MLLIVEYNCLEAISQVLYECSIFPNPTKREITFSQAIEKVEVIDLIGKTIVTFTNAESD